MPFRFEWIERTHCAVLLRKICCNKPQNADLSASQDCAVSIAPSVDENLKYHIKDNDIGNTLWDKKVQESKVFSSK